MDYEALVQDVQDGKITLVEFVMKQEDLANEFIEFTSAYELTISDDTAKLFLDKKEEEIMQSQQTIV